MPGPTQFLLFLYALPALSPFAKVTCQRAKDAGKDACGHCARDGPAWSRKDLAMNLVVWLPAMFVLGWAGLFACLAFTEACARI